MSQRQPDRDGDDGPRIVVEDPEDFARTRQLRSVFDARDDYVKTRKKTGDAFRAGSISIMDRWEEMQDELTSLIMQLEPLMMRTESGQHLLHDEKFSFPRMCWRYELPQVQDVKDMDAFDELPSSWGSEYKVKRFIYDEFGPEDRALDFEGLLKFTEQVTIAYPDQKHRKWITGTFSKQLQDEAYRRCLDYIQEIGLGLDTDQAEQQTKVDDDLLDEVEEWRASNT